MQNSRDHQVVEGVGTTHSSVEERFLATHDYSKSEGKTPQPCWDLVRWMMSQPEFRGAEIAHYKQLAANIGARLHVLYPEQFPYHGDQEFCWVEFLVAAEDAKLGEGENPLDVAAEEEEAQPIKIPVRTNSADHNRLIGIAYYLQLMLGEKPIMLPVPNICRVIWER